MYLNLRYEGIHHISYCIVYTLGGLSRKEKMLCTYLDITDYAQMLSMLILNETIRVDLVVFLAIFAE